MPQQYNFFKDESAEDAGKLECGDKTAYTLPSGAGYNVTEFKEDVYSAFSGHKRSDLDDVTETWEDHVLYKGNEFGGKYVSLGQARETVKAFDKFFDKLDNSPIKKALLDFNNGDAVKASQTFMDWVEYHANAAQDGQGFAESVMEAMEKLEEDPDFKGKVPGPSDGAGGGFNCPLTAKALRVKELLPKVRKKYEFAAVRSYVYEDSLYPEDDIDITNMTSYGEIMRIPKTMLGEEDDEFFLRMATKNFPVMEYKKAIPMPKKFIVLVDISGSMRQVMDKDGYLRSEYAQATAVALAEQAELGGNSCEVIYFDEEAHPPVTGSPKEIQAKLLKEQFAGGGTNFEPAFRAADKSDADSVVIVTDGGGNFTTPPKAPLMSLMIGGENPVLRQSSYRYEQVGQ